MRRTISATAGLLVAGALLIVLLGGLLTGQPAQVAAAPDGGPYEDIVPAFRPEGSDEFFFEIWNGWDFTVTGYITVYTGITISDANIVGALPIALSPQTTTTIPIAGVPGVPLGHAGFAQVWTERIVNSSAFSTQGRYHLVALGQMDFGPPPVVAADSHGMQHLPTGSGPYSITIQAGDTVSWVNSRWAAFNHSVQADDDSFSSGAPNTSWRIFSHTFTAPGAYAYYCATHGGKNGLGMAGVVIVEGDAPVERTMFLPMIQQERD